MNRKAVVTIAILLPVVITSLIAYWMWPHDATIYAAGYTSAKFRQVKKGMSETDVERILGKPLTNVEGHIQGLPVDRKEWNYAYYDIEKLPAPTDDRIVNTWFKIREVDFDERGRVKKVIKSREQFE